MFGSATNKFRPEYFIVKSPSEHTINGKYMDIELQIYHYPVMAMEGEEVVPLPEDQTIRKAVISVLFSVDKWTAPVSIEQNQTIVDFMKELKLAHDHKSQNTIKIGNLRIGNVMDFLDFSKRWIYQGTETIPPC